MIGEGQIRPTIAPEDWKDWHWQARNSIKTVERLSEWINVTPDEDEAIRLCKDKYRWAITPYYAALMDPDDPQCPVRLQAVPSLAEFQPTAHSVIDAIGDLDDQKTNRIIHKYPDRVAFLVTAHCPAYCRHCVRKHHTMTFDSNYFTDREAASMDADFAYIADHPEVRDVVLTGGDPLAYNDRQLERIISAIRSIPHVEIIRIGSRLPVMMPQRVTTELCSMLDEYQPMWLNTHFNHPREITDDSAAACERLVRAGVPVGNQTALLKGVNDSLEIIRKLCTELVRIRVRPYYLYHCDNTEGVGHFGTSLEEGMAIMEGLIGPTSGFAVPQYIVSSQIGKIPVAPEYLRKTDTGYIARNWRGDTVELPWI